MQHTINIRLRPKDADNLIIIKKSAAKKLGVSEQSITHIQIKKRSIDARQKAVKYFLSILVYVEEAPPVIEPMVYKYSSVENSSSVLVIGAGPAGLFAALQLIEQGLKPIILERGKDVKARRRDLAAIHKEHLVNPESNYCFGEGGAGTYSDGKLYTRSNKRGDVRKVLNLLVAHGADDNILIDAHPHIGTNKLPKIITNIRESILKAGGEIHFNTKLIDLVIEKQQIDGAITNQGTFHAKHLILATGHSARDIFELLARKNIAIENKPFAMGVRIEHSQSLIDEIQYKTEDRGEYLPPAPYSLVQQVRGNRKYKQTRGVYSFCMCPGGIIAPCATNHEEVVTNGWSPSRRNNPYANSGVVVTIEPKDYQNFKQYGALAGMYFQASVEKKAWEAGGKTQAAPAQRMIDFIDNRLSKDLPKTSYQPGVKSVLLSSVLPPVLNHYLKKGLLAFGKTMRGYLTNEAIVVGVESRSSSPVRIPRDTETLQHPKIQGLYPSGEGAGYAGGIVSAAIDGMRCAEKIALRF